MDVGGSLRLSVCLLIAAAGCQHQVVTLPSSAPLSSLPGHPDPSQVKKAPANPKGLPPLVLVSYGDYEAGEAFAEQTTPERRRQLCEAARADYQRALSADPKCVPAYQGLAHLYKAMHDLPLAVETYQKALKLMPKNASLWYELGLCHNSQKNLGPALECLERAARIEPGNSSYANAQGVVLAQAGRYQDSLKCFARSSGEAMGYYRLAQTLRHLQKPELSRQYLEVALQKDPSLAPTIQQASYQPPASPGLNVPQPQVAPAASQPAPPPVVLPPVPPINGDDEPSQ